MTDAANFMATYQRHQEALAKTNELNKSAVFDALASLGITSVRVNFNGEGDSGQIEETVAYQDKQPTQIPNLNIDFHRIGWGNSEATTSPSPLHEAIETLCYDYLSQEHGGWENNDGGYGDFVFHVSDRRIELDIGLRFTDSTHYSHEF